MARQGRRQQELGQYGRDLRAHSDASIAVAKQLEEIRQRHYSPVRRQPQFRHMQVLEPPEEYVLAQRASIFDIEAVAPRPAGPPPWGSASSPPPSLCYHNLTPAKRPTSIGATRGFVGWAAGQPAIVPRR